MSATDLRRYLPGFRNIIFDISNAGGPLCRIDEIVDEHGIERLIEVLDLGMVVYQAGDLLFVPVGDFRIYAEMADGIANDDDDAMDEEAKPLKAVE